ncbi:MAG: hypothetical protein KKB20_26890 [Proteobacteria bacterium]|nr:hypothetical protein [Pseudomonadota bacterium]
MGQLTPLAITAIGTVPFLDLDWTLDFVARTSPDIPYWPQMVRRHPREDMVLQAVDGLTPLEMDEARHRVTVKAGDREQALTEFYEHFLAQDWDYFAVPPEAGSCLRLFLDRAKSDPAFGPEFLKAQVIGPVSFGQSVRTPEDRTLLDDPELADMVVKGLGAKAAWLAREILATGRTPLIFFDEPGLTGLGSAHSNLSGERVVAMLDEAAEIVRSVGPAFVGVHICGNSDWGAITSANLDVINFDAYGFLDHFLLYPKEIRKFLERGGHIAWGIVPTLDYTGEQTARGLADKLKAGWSALAGRGLDLDLVRSRSLITPACGVGAIGEEAARAILELLPPVQALVRT